MRNLNEYIKDIVHTGGQSTDYTEDKIHVEDTLASDSSVGQSDKQPLKNWTFSDHFSKFFSNSKMFQICSGACVSNRFFLAETLRDSSRLFETQ